MARTKEFDTDEALERSLGIFWEKGFEATSIQDLVDATGVNRASLYETFGRKRELFRRALERFGSSNGIEAMTAAAEPGLAKIRAALRSAGEQSIRDARGCMLVNTIIECGGRDEELSAIGRSARISLEEFFSRCLVEAQRRGEIPARRDRRSVARLLTNTLFGLRVTAKTGASPEFVRSIVNTTLRLVEQR
jgi:TetR/AcrR family transcriptional repressor of nem operon